MTDNTKLIEAIEQAEAALDAARTVQEAIAATMIATTATRARRDKAASNVKPANLTELSDAIDAGIESAKKSLGKRSIF